MNKGWLELESDPGLFTLLLEEYGVHGVQVEEIYDLQKPMEGEVYGFIFLFRWIEERRSRRKTNTEVESFVTDVDAVNNIFFAQQIIPNSCATHALLSVLLNCDNKVKLGKTLTLIKDFTENMSPEDKGFAIANMPELARVHNSFARPETSKPVPEKQSGLSSVRSMDSETFHFVSYVPIRGHLFEIDGLKPHPIDHGPCEKGEAWTEKFRRVISDRLGMATGGEPYHDIRFNLMAVVPDKRQLLEQKLTTLKTNRNIVLEALQQLLDAKVVSPASSEKSDNEGKTQWAKKSVTFEEDTTVIESSSSPETHPHSGTTQLVSSTTSGRVQTVSSPNTQAPATKPVTSLPASILKPSSSSSLFMSSCPASLPTDPPSSDTVTSGFVSSSMSVTTESMSGAPPIKLRSVIAPGKPSIGTSEIILSSMSSDCREEIVTTTEDDATLPRKDSHCVKNNVIYPISAVNQESPFKHEPMDTFELTSTSDVKLIHEAKEVTIKIEVTEADSNVVVENVKFIQGLKSDVTKPLSIETKFNISPCAGSSESTDTASEIGSGFSSPGSLNTSSCQSSPQYSDGTTGTDAKCENEVHHHHHRDRRKRRSSQAFTPKDLLDLLKNVENEIELCETNLREENEKRKKYKIDACRRTHNYDQFIVTFLSMLAEQGLLGDLMEENMTIKKPGGGNTASTPKMTKKALLKATEKKKKSKMKKKGKK